MKYTLKRIVRNEKVSAKTNKPYTSVGIQVAEFGEQWINGFGNKQNASWKEGDSIEIEIKDNVYNGKTTKQFEMPKLEEKVAHEMNNVGFKLGVMNAKLDKILALVDNKTSNGQPMPDFSGVQLRPEVIQRANLAKGSVAASVMTPADDAFAGMDEINPNDIPF